MRNCRHVEMQLSAYVDGQCDAPQRQAVEAHVQECFECAATLRAMRLGVDALRGMETVEVSDAFWLRLRERLPEKRPSLWQRWITTLRWGWAERQRVAFQRVAVAAVALIVIAVPSWMGLKGQRKYVDEQYVQRCEERHALYLAHQPFGDSISLTSELTE